MWPFPRSARASVINNLERFLKKDVEYQRINWGEFERALDMARRLPNPVEIGPYVERFRAGLAKVGEYVIPRKLVDYLAQHEKLGKK